jgi:hypothetical protein
MEKRTCSECGKEVEGYNRNHVNFLLMQHQLKHRAKLKSKLKQEVQK